MDRLTKEQRHRNMAAIKNKDSKIELALRKALFKEGLRYRKNVKNIKGNPDIVFLKYKIAIFCDGEYWHGYKWEQRKNDIKSNREFWINKIERNMQRDIEVNEELINNGWTVVRFWGKEILKDTDNCVKKIKAIIKERNQDNL